MPSVEYLSSTTETERFPGILKVYLSNYRETESFQSGKLQSLAKRLQIWGIKLVYSLKQVQLKIGLGRLVPRKSL